MMLGCALLPERLFFYFSGKFIKRAVSHSFNGQESIKQRVIRFFKTEPYPGEPNPYADAPICITAGAVAALSATRILSGISSLVSAKNSPFTKALAIKALVHDALARNNLLEKAARQSLLRMN